MSDARLTNPKRISSVEMIFGSRPTFCADVLRSQDH